MAYRPSLRRTRATTENLEPNLTPIMNLMVVLIPLLLSSAQLIKISVIELNLPPAAGPALTQNEQPKEKVIKLDLSVTITDKGFFVSSAAEAKKGKGPSIPKKDGKYDYEMLARKLYEIKQNAVNRFKDTDAVTIQAEPGIGYQTLVSTMDAARSIKVDDKLLPLFPKVSISAAVL